MFLQVKCILIEILLATNISQKHDKKVINNSLVLEIYHDEVRKFINRMNLLIIKRLMGKALKKNRSKLHANFNS